jgi:hypothetical protein
VALVYAVDLDLFDGRTTEPADPIAIAKVVGSWAGCASPLVDGRTSAVDRPDATIEIDTVRVAGDLVGWRLTLRHADSVEAGVMWSVAVSLTVAETVHMCVRSQRQRIGGALRPLHSDPKPPRFVREILDPDDDRFLAMDGTWDVQSAHSVINQRNAERFAGFLLSARRRLPVIGFTARDDDVFEARKFVERVVGSAHVALIKPEASWVMDEILPTGTNVYGGAVRLWWPGLSSRSSRFDHPLWTADRRSRLVYDEVNRKIAEASVAVSAQNPRLQALLRSERRRELDRLRGSNAELQQRIEDAESGPTRGQAQDVVAESARVLDDLEAAYSLMDEQEAEIDQLRQALEDVSREVRNVAGERDHWKHAATAGSEATEITAQDLLRAEIAERAKLLLNPGETRLKPFVLGPRFASAIEQLGARYRGAAVDVAACLIVGRPDLLAKVDDHPLRTGSAPSAPQRIREIDGAKAYRAYLESNTAAARRLHYWKLPDNTIELASVNVHEDMTIP